MILKIKGMAHRFYKAFLCLKGDPRKIAMGMAIGVFIGVTPTIPLHTVLIMGAIFLFRQNLTAALIGAWITNPVTIPIFYFAEYEIGRYLLGWGKFEIVFQQYNVQEFLKAGWEILYPLQLGGLVLAPFFAVPAYFITYHAVTAIRRRRNADCERTASEI